MKRIHPRLASAIFIVIYYLLILLIKVIFNVKIYESKLFFPIGLIGVAIINKLFANKYYDAILEEKKQEEEFFKKVNENLENNSRIDKTKDENN